MKQLSICLSLLFCLITLTQAQTKAIAFKSHSGNENDFAAALKNGDMEEDDFGLAPSDIVKTTRLDSVKYISPAVVVMYTSSTYAYQLSGKTTPWKPLRDTVYDHPLFSHQHALDSIKQVLKTSYHFQNSIDSVKFIGFDNGLPAKTKSKKHRKEAVILPSPSVPAGPGNNDSITDRSGLLALGLTIAFLLPVSLLLRKVYYNFKDFHPEAEQSFT